MKRIIGGLVGLGCLVWLGIFAFGFLAAMWDDWHDSPGKEQFNAANNQISVYSNEVGFGNSEAAKQIAKEYSEKLLKDCHDLFKLGSTFNPTTMNNCLTYCQLDASSVVLLCQVPDMRGFRGDVLKLLAKMARGRAVEITGERLPGKKLKMAVGLRGFGSYGAIMEGPSDGNPTVTSLEEASSGSQLYPYFVQK